MNQKRVNFEIIRSQYRRRGVDNVRLTQSSLLLIQSIDPNKTVYSFDVLESQVANLLPQEIRLNINDEFITTNIGVYLYGNIGFGDPVSKQPIMLSYSPFETAADFLSVAPLYDGQLKIGVNNIIYVEKWDLKKHNFVPRTQFDSYDTGTTLMASQPSMDYEHNGMFAADPMVTLSGAKKNEITISLAQALKSATGTWQTVSGGVAKPVTVTIDKIAIFLRGLNAQNASKFQ